MLAALVAAYWPDHAQPLALVVAVALALLAVRETTLMLGVIAALLAGAVLAQARLAALDRTALEVPGAVAGRATLLEQRID